MKADSGYSLHLREARLRGEKRSVTASMNMTPMPHYASKSAMLRNSALQNCGAPRCVIGTDILNLTFKRPFN